MAAHAEHFSRKGKARVSASVLVERNYLAKLFLGARQESGVDLVNLGLSQHMRRNREAAGAI